CKIGVTKFAKRLSPFVANGVCDAKLYRRDACDACAFNAHSRVACLARHLASDLAFLSLNSLPSAGGHAALTITGRPRRGSLRPAVGQICKPMDFGVNRFAPAGI